jgi:hypothetical protein
VIAAVALRPDEAINDYRSAQAALGDSDGLYHYDDVMRAFEKATTANDTEAAERMAELADRVKQMPDQTLRSSERAEMDRAARELKAGLAAILAPIFITFITGAALLWAVRGFRSDRA